MVFFNGKGLSDPSPPPGADAWRVAADQPPVAIPSAGSLRMADAADQPPVAIPICPWERSGGFDMPAAEDYGRF